MAYVPFRMDGNGGCNLPIIDILQTFNASKGLEKKSLSPLLSTTTRGFNSLKKKIEWANIFEKEIPGMSGRRSASYDSFSTDRRKNYKNPVASTSKIMKYTQTANKFHSCHCDDDIKSLKEKKSLQTLFRAGKSRNSFDKEDGYEEDLRTSFPVYDRPLRNLKRKASFVACESISGYITNDYQNKISFLSTRLAIDSNVSSLLKQAAVRSLSCEVVPGKEGQVYFGDSVRGHILSHTFFLKDTQARGFHRWYSIVVFMRDKHFLLNSWNFFKVYINQIVAQLQKKATMVYSNEQNVCSQRAFRLSSLGQNHYTARSLIKLMSSSNVFAQLHLWFSWILSMGGKRLEEHLPNRLLDYRLLEAKNAGVNEGGEKLDREEAVSHLRLLRRIFGPYNFQKIVYSTLIGRQVIVRGPRTVVENIICLLRLFLPAKKFNCQEFSDTYKTPEFCNIIGLDLSAAVPKSSDTIIRLDIVPYLQPGAENSRDQCKGLYNAYNFLIKNESNLPEKLPSLLVKVDKALSDESLSDRVVYLHFMSLMEHWLHLAEVIKEVKNKSSCSMSVMQILGIQDQDCQLIEFWTS